MASERIQRQIERLLDEAEEAVGRSDWARARDRASNALRFDPDNADAQAFLAAADRDEQDLTPLALEDSPQSERLPALPISFANGRYEVKRFLGERAPIRIARRGHVGIRYDSVPEWPL